MPVYETTPDGSIRKRRGRPPKSETDALAVRPTTEIDINTFDPVAFEIELFNAIRTHTDNSYVFFLFKKDVLIIFIGIVFILSYLKTCLTVKNIQSTIKQSRIRVH